MLKSLAVFVDLLIALCNSINSGFDDISVGIYNFRTGIFLVNF